MPVVPRAEQNVAANAFQGPKIAPVQPYQQLNAQAQDRTFGAAEKLMAGIYEEERKKANQLAVLDFASKASAFGTQIDIGLENFKGKDAAGALDYFEKEWQPKMAEMEKGAANDEQKLSFRNIAESKRMELYGKVQRHMASERGKYDDEVTDSFIKNTSDWAVRNYQDPDVVNGSLDVIEAVMKDKAARKGFSKDDPWTTKKIADEKAAVHKSVLTRMLANGQDMAAAEYFKANKAGFGGDVAELEAKLVSSSIDGEASRIASAIFKENGPKKDIDPVNIYQMVESVREKYGDNPKLFKAISTELKDMGANWNAKQKENEEANEASVWGAVEKGTTLTQVRTMPEYLNLSGDKQVTVKNAIVDRAYALANREDKKPNDKQWAEYWKYSEPDTLDSMTEAQVQNLLPTIGRQLTNNLMAQKRALGKGDLSEVKLDNDLFKQAAQGAGLNPFKPKLSEKEKARLADLKDSVMTSLAIEQQAKGRKLTREEKQKHIQTEIDKKVLVDTNIFFKDPEKSALILTDEERGKAYIPLEKISTADRDKMKNLLIKKGKAVTADKMQRLYAADVLGDRALFESILGEK